MQENHVLIALNLETPACESIRETLRHCRCTSKGCLLFAKIVRQVLFDIGARNSN